jgi:hypothetical protein
VIFWKGNQIFRNGSRIRSALLRLSWPVELGQLNRHDFSGLGALGGRLWAGTDSGVSVPLTNQVFNPTVKERTCAMSRNRRNVKNSRVLLVGVALSFACVVSGHTTDQGIPFTSAGIASLPGRDLCNLQGEFPNRFGVYLDDKKERSVDYRERDGVIALFLLEESLPPKYCGIVDATLDLTSLRKGEETPLFKCHVNSEGRTRWGHVVGLGDNQRGRKRFLAPRLAWRVNTKEKRFDQIKGKAVSCDASGYIVGDGWY